MAANNAATTSISTDSNKYRSLVIDSGPIIKLTGVSSLRERAEHFYTVPAVLNEIRDAKARHHLQNLPFDIVTREPSPASIQAVTEFARLTGDYRSLSKVDMLVLALVYELEKEGCEGSMEHIRTKPKRTLGIGKVELLNPKSKPANEKAEEKQDEKEEEEEDIEYDVVEEEDDEEEEGDDNQEVSFFEGTPQVEAEKEKQSTSSPGLKSWAMLVNPSSASQNKEDSPEEAEEQAIHIPLGKMNLNTGGGQFDDADEVKEEAADSDGAGGQVKVEEELQQDFPSLAASLHVPFEGEDDEMEDKKEQSEEESKEAREAVEAEENEELRKQEALKPLSKSGKTYNSFRGYGKLFKPAPKKKPVNSPDTVVEEEKKVEPTPEDEGYGQGMAGQSRIIGGVHMSGQEVDIEDDGEGWVTCTKDIRSLQAAGTLAPPKNGLENDANIKGPAMNQRAACATTDFAMQNVLLQMNLELLSVDGVKIRKLKNWVTRCGACFKVCTKNDDAGPRGMKRLFCERCGSDMLQRIAASVDGKTGRLRLHMSKKHKNSTRGTKFSLPKPGSGNRFQGDILLREDQLMMGAWNQKVKMRSGGKAKSAAQSMFGQDIAANVGCKAKAMNVDDIAAGFGRRNPNAAKGRERRGKKKKSKTEKACGLRRYH